jgi:large subunit ribosomal protein L25
MKEITIEVKTRHSSGKGVARKMRAQGLIPGVVYGKGEEPMAIEMDRNHFHNVMRRSTGENPLINLTIDGQASNKMALIRDMQRDPVDGHLLHIDFQHISLTEKIKVRVPIVLEGTPDGVKNFGGIVNWAVRDVEVQCLPTDIPERFTLDISALKIHESLHVKDIRVEKAEILESLEETIVTVVPPTIIKEATPAEGEAAAVVAIPVEGEEPTEPEVIAEKKAEERKAEREKEKGPEGKGGKEKGAKEKGAKEKGGKEKGGKEKE